MKELTIPQLINMDFQVNKEPILAPFGFSFVVADPSLLTPAEAVDGRFHMFFHCTTGVYHFTSDDGIGSQLSSDFALSNGHSLSSGCIVNGTCAAAFSNDPNLVAHSVNL